MHDAHVVWDLPDDPEGNTQHIAEHGFTQDDVEDVLFGAGSETTSSRSTGEWITFGYTSSGQYIAVVWEHIDEDPLTVYPITAYEAPERRRKRK
jgi:hypothetical protein